MSSNPQIGLFPGPAWYSSDWIRRWPIAVDAVTAGNSGSKDVDIVIPATWDWFWNGVQDQTNGRDIVVCGSDGVTLLAFQYSGLNFTTRTLTLQINALALDGTGKMNMIWLYWFQTSAVSDLTSPFTPAAQITGYITLVGPASGYQASFEQASLDATAPEIQWEKKSTETLTGWVDLSTALSLSGNTYNGKYNREGVKHVTCAEFTPGQLTVTNTLTRYTYYDSRLWVLANISGGASETDDGVKYTIETTEGRILDYRVGLVVLDPTQ